MEISSLKSKLIILFLTAMILLSGAFRMSSGAIYAQEVCTVDQQGANDETGQKDVTYGCLDDTNAPTSIDVTWQWDESGWPGSNTGDGCLTFDADSDGNADYAACVQVSGNPSEMVNPPHPIIYSCNNTLRVICGGGAPIAGPFQSTCEVAVLPNDPFDDTVPNGPGDDYPDDTVVNCTLFLDDFGAPGDLEIIDNCSYPSAVPNSNPSDCVINPTNPNTLTLAEPVSAAWTITHPLSLIVVVAMISGLMLIALLLWKRREI